MRRLLVVLSLASLALGASTAMGHKTGTEQRTPEECKKLQAPARGHCLECISRARPHHFHADAPAGNQCTPEQPSPTPPG
jgi:hypothetical protein